MRVRRTARFILLALAAIAVWTAVSRRQAKPYPALFAWLLGTQTTLDQIGLRPGQRVLEIGPGSGRLLIPAAQRVLPGGTATGLEVQSGMVQMLRQHATQAGATNVVVVQGDATASHFSPESFDLIYLCAVLGEIADRAAVLRHCYAILKPGGTLSITEGWPDPHYQPRDVVQNLAETTGFCAIGLSEGRAAIQPTSCGRSAAVDGSLPPCTPASTIPNRAIRRTDQGASQTTKRRSVPALRPVISQIGEVLVAPVGVAGWITAGFRLSV